MKVFNLYQTQYAYDGPIKEWHVRVEPTPLDFLTDDGCRMHEVCVVTYDNCGIVIDGDENIWPRNASVRFFI